MLRLPSGDIGPTRRRAMFGPWGAALAAVCWLAVSGTPVAAQGAAGAASGPAAGPAASGVASGAAGAPQAPGPGASPSSTTVHRCDVGGRVVFQQAPCPPGQGRVVAVPPANVVSAPPRAAASAPAGGASAAATPPVAQASAPTPTSDEQACLAFLRPLLVDPSSGRILSARREGRVLFVQLQANDQRGRPRLRDAACEFVNGRVDDSWSRIQLRRLGWFAPRTLVQGASSEARRAARALEESIEAPTR